MPCLWRTSTLEVVALLPQGFDSGAGLPARLRGALGHALLDARDEPEAEAARAVLFDPIPWRPRTELPKPFVIATDNQHGYCRIRLTLFGLADRWRKPVFDALLAGLARGIAVAGGNGAPRHPLPVVSAEWSRSETIAVPSPGLAARLVFRTPLRLGGGRVLHSRWGDVVVSLAERVAGLALWQGFAVEPDLGIWRTLANDLAFRDDALNPVAWERRSGAQGGRAIPMSGYLGLLDIDRPPERLMPLLALGATTHVGGGASLGLGRYDLV